MFNIEESQDLQEIDVCDSNLVKKLGKGSSGPVYKLLNQT